mgnify:CR=1 FL=1
MLNFEELMPHLVPYTGTLPRFKGPYLPTLILYPADKLLTSRPNDPSCEHIISYKQLARGFQPGGDWNSANPKAVYLIILLSGTTWQDRRRQDILINRFAEAKPSASRDSKA